MACIHLFIFTKNISTAVPGLCLPAIGLIIQLFVALMSSAKWFCQLYLRRSIASHLIEVFNKHSELFRTYYRLMCLRRGLHSSPSIGRRQAARQ